MSPLSPWILARGIWLLALLAPLLSEALVVSSSGRINFRNEGAVEGSSGTVNCQGDGIECEMVNGILNVNVGGGAETSLEDPGGNGLILRTGAGVTDPYPGTTCTNEFVRALSASGVATCDPIASTDVDASICTTAGVCTGYQAALGFTAEDVANKDNAALSASTTTYPTSGATKSYVDTADALRELLSNKSTDTALGASNTLYPTQKAVKDYVDNAVPAITGGPGIVVSGGTVSAALHEAGALTDGTEAVLTCGADQGGKWQIGPANELQYCDYAETPALRSGLLTPTGLTWGDTTACASDENLGKLTVVSGVIGCFPDVADASTAAWNDGGTTSLTCGGGAQGQHQVMDSGRVEYCGGETASALYAGFLLPSPLSFNINPDTCTGDANGGKLTVNGSNQVVCATDSVGEGDSGPGDMTGVGNIASGDAGTAGFPLTNLWYIASTAPSPPASTQGLLWLDETSQTFSIITSDGVIKRMVQSVDAVPNQFLTALAPGGSFSQAQPSSANLSDGNTLAKLTGPQTLTTTFVPPTVCTLSASSGTVTAPNADLCTVFERHDVAGTLTIPNPTATGSNPRTQQSITFSFYAASEQTVAWDTGYAEGYGVALPTTLPAGRYVGVRMQWNTLSAKWETWGNTDDTVAGVADGGTGVATLTGLAIGNGTSAFTAITSSTVGQIPRVTGANTYGFGALDLADTDAVTNILPVANGGTGLASGTSGGVLAYTASGALASSGALTANLPVIGGGPGVAPTVGTRSGNTTAFVTTTGAQTSGDCVTIDANGNHVAAGAACGTGSGGTGTIQLSVVGLKLAASNTATPDVSQTNDRLLFDASTEECGIWQGTVPADYASTPVAKLNYSMVSATTNSVAMGFAVMAVTGGDSADVNTESYDTENVCTDTVAGTAGHMKLVSCALTNFDSAAIRDFFKVKLCRKIAHASDTATGDLEALTLTIEYQR